MIATYLYTIRAGQSVRVPIDLDAVRRDRMWAVDMELAEPYDEPPLRAQMPTAEQRRLEYMVGARMRSTDNANAGLTRHGKPQGQSRKDKSK